MNQNWIPLAQMHLGGSRELVDTLARTPLSRILAIVVVLTLLRVLVYPFHKAARKNRGFAFKFYQFLNESFDSLAFAGVLVFMLVRPYVLQTFLIPTGSMWPELYVNSFIVANKAIYRISDPKPGDVVVFHPPKQAALAPDDLDAEGEMKADFIKRCIGTPGDLIEMKNGMLYRNGKHVDEPYTVFSKCIDQNKPCQDYQKLSDAERSHVMSASFKLVKLNGKLIPLNYTKLDANAPVPMVNDLAATEGPYSIAEDYQIGTREEQQRAVHLPAERLPAGMYLMMGDNRNNSFDGRGWGLVSRDRIVGRAEFVWWPISQAHRTH